MSIAKRMGIPKNNEARDDMTNDNDARGALTVRVEKTTGGPNLYIGETLVRYWVGCAFDGEAEALADAIRSALAAPSLPASGEVVAYLCHEKLRPEETFLIRWQEASKFQRASLVRKPLVFAGSFAAASAQQDESNLIRNAKAVVAHWAEFGPEADFARAVDALDSALNSPTSAQRDACEVCRGTKGGVPGNENIIGGRPVCDYCHADGSYKSVQQDEREALYQVIHAALMDHGMSYTEDTGSGEKFPLVDKLCAPGDKTIKTGKYEIAILAEAIVDAIPSGTLSGLVLSDAEIVAASAQQDERELAPCIGQCGNAVTADGDRICHECAQQDEREALRSWAEATIRTLFGCDIAHDLSNLQREVDELMTAAQSIPQQEQADAGAVAVAKVLSEEEMGTGFDRRFGPVIWFNGYPKPGYLYTRPAAESDKRDAERWRWLREQVHAPESQWDVHGPDEFVLGTSDLDDSVDAAMSREQSGGGE